MTSLISDKRYLLFVTVLQGRSFPIRPYDFVRIDVKFNGKALNTSPVPLTKDPFLKTDLVFRLTGRQLENHKIHKSPIKIEVYHVNTRTKKQYRIGYQILDLRIHDMEVGKPRFSWLPLFLTQTCCAKAEIHLGISVEDDFESENRARNRSEFTRTPQPNEIEIINDDMTSHQIDHGRPELVASEESSSATPERCGFSQLPHAVICRIFSFLDANSRFKLRRVSKKWRDLLDDPQFYRTLEVDTEALLNPWFCGFIEERGILSHVNRLILYSRYEMSKNPPDEPSADPTSLPIPRWSDTPEALSEFFEYFKERGCILEEICLRDMAIDLEMFVSWNASFPPFKVPCRLRLLNVEFEFNVTGQRVRLFCDAATIDGVYVDCVLFYRYYRIPRSFRDFILKKIQPLTPEEARNVKNLYLELVKGRPDCAIRLEAIMLLKDLGYYQLPTGSLDSYVDSLPETLRLREFNFENWDKYTQFRLVHFSKARHFFQLMPDPKYRQDNGKFERCAIYPR